MVVDATPSWNQLRSRGRSRTNTRVAATLRGAGRNRSLRSTKRTYSRWTCCTGHCAPTWTWRFNITGRLRRGQQSHHADERIIHALPRRE
eukprot:2081839-Pyramimonas_sp.AAC.1